MVKLVDFGVSRLLENSREPVIGKTAGRADAPLALAVTAHDATVKALDATMDDPDRPPPAAVTMAEPVSSKSTPPAVFVRSRPSGELTQTGVVIGTPLYIAPELRTGSNLARPPADIFSFGVLAYEVLTGVLPFGEDPLWLMMRGAGDSSFVPLSRRCPNLDPELALLLQRCLAAEPAQRPSATELLTALTAAPLSQTPPSVAQ